MSLALGFKINLFLIRPVVTLIDCWSRVPIIVDFDTIGCKCVFLHIIDILLRKYGYLLGFILWVETLLLSQFLSLVMFLFCLKFLSVRSFTVHLCRIKFYLEVFAVSRHIYICSLASHFTFSMCCHYAVISSLLKCRSHNIDTNCIFLCAVSCF